ncbi:DNA-processing protein DprA [Pusillimonas noertemannii]|uniref:DNA protecting protein DprA n=1 Tax=Pusillimonas noertemannii TaxID=305977 RepID=A0A2U1CNC1_9BURK|nr:DNA-processing protein DprA [Pusillimonas noertemannii]NYT68481.1 DNA-protecting protein DprA [Pusillimonas noertemannii]PVY62502.1 DNA protecting protein DprA [Pusillimonas noertemannii]TFL10544.1 DNA-protecting protein DprA [Pusillimonas noertemannii]
MHTPPSSDELSAWLRLTLEPGLGPVQARGLLAGIGLPQDIYASSAATLTRYVPAELAAQLRRPLSSEIQACIERTLQWLAEPGHHLITLADPAYPAALLDTHDPPTVLYANGRPELLNRPVIAIVGARNATPGGCDNARAFAQYLAGQGWCIASGLAHGIDAAAHQGALAAGAQAGSTIAVMGTGIDIVYPSANLALARRIADEGVLVSELPLGTPSISHQFPRRNRIVAGLARGVLVVEAAKQSGSLITARLATELGREVFSIPGSIHSPLSRGCHALIRQGAKLVESGQDIHEELDRPGPGPADSQAALEPAQAGKDKNRRRAGTARQGSRTQNAAEPLSASAASGAQHPLFARNTPEALVLQALGHDPADADTLQSRTGMDISQLGSLLLRLELEEAVARLEDGRYQRLAAH